MAEALRFHLDEHVPKAVATGLRSHGIDVTTPADAGLLSAKDHEHLAFAASQARILVTHDRHFLRHAASGVVHAGVAYCHQEKYGGKTGVVHITRQIEQAGEAAKELRRNGHPWSAVARHRFRSVLSAKRHGSRGPTTGSGKRKRRQVAALQSLRKAGHRRRGR